MSNNRNNLSLNSDSLNQINSDEFAKAIKTLEFDKVLEILSQFCTVDAARDEILKIRPSVSAEEIKKRLKETSDAKALIEVKSYPSFSGVKDITAHLNRAEKGATLSMAELLDIASLLSEASSAAVYFNQLSENNSLCDYANKISCNKFLNDRITTCIVSEEVMADNASPVLYDIRRKIRNAQNKVRDTLQKYVSGGENSKYLQENIITMRGGRYVIPVKSEYKNEIKGLVHDASGSGATVFIEPMAVVEANNELRTLESKEKAEIERILSELTSEVLRFSPNLLGNFVTLKQLALIFAKARMSLEYNCCEPQINNRKYIRLLQARHPLLNRDTVVPIDVYIGKSFTTLVITGPNTGGKTVTLKTIGLFCLMAQSGLHIPAQDGSEVPVLEGIHADIGDEQSIEQSLSTFSAHMVNIVDILSRFTPNSLILFDELGAGTDPIEGAALAQSILERVTSCGCLCAATTHYAELKAYALEADKVTNASCEFDIDTLKPTYKLNIGMPGRSNAFAIAKKLGLSDNIIKSSQAKINGETRSFEGLIGKLEQTRIELENQRQRAEKLKKQAEEMFDKSEKQRLEFNRRMEQESAKAEKKANELLERARSSADYVFDQLQEIQRKKDSQNFKEELERSRQNVRKALGVSENTQSSGGKIELKYVPPRDFLKGDKVLLSDFGKTGEILSIDGENAVVQVGSAKLKTKLKSLRLIEEKQSDKKKAISHSPRKATEIKTETDVRGLIGDDAIFVVDKFLDDAVLSGLENIRIIHGKGTGALRKALWDYFKRDPRIKSYRLGTFGEGDAGVTVVTLK